MHPPLRQADQEDEQGDGEGVVGVACDDKDQRNQGHSEEQRCRQRPFLLQHPAGWHLSGYEICGGEDPDQHHTVPVAKRRALPPPHRLQTDRDGIARTDLRIGRNARDDGVRDEEEKEDVESIPSDLVDSLHPRALADAVPDSVWRFTAVVREEGKGREILLVRLLEEEGMRDNDAALCHQTEDTVQSREGEENTGADAETVCRFREGRFGHDAQQGDQQSA